MDPCARWEGSSPQTPPVPLCRAGEGTLYFDLLVAHPCVTQEPQRLCFDLHEGYLTHAKTQDFPGLFPRAHALLHGPGLG